MVFMETSRSLANDSASQADYLSKGNTIWAKFIFDLSFNEIEKSMNRATSVLSPSLSGAYVHLDVSSRF
jgi:hypothetical protein